MDTLTRFHKEKIHRPNRMIKNREVGSLFKNLAANTEDAMIESINKMLCKMYFSLLIPKTIPNHEKSVNIKITMIQ